MITHHLPQHFFDADSVKVDGYRIRFTDGFEEEVVLPDPTVVFEQESEVSSPAQQGTQLSCANVGDSAPISEALDAILQFAPLSTQCEVYNAALFQLFVVAGGGAGGGSVAQTISS